MQKPSPFADRSLLKIIEKYKTVTRGKLAPGGQSGFTGKTDIFRISDQQTRSHLFLRLFKNIGTPGLSLSRQTNKADTQVFVKTAINFHCCTSFCVSLEAPCLVPRSNPFCFFIWYPLY